MLKIGDRREVNFLEVEIRREHQRVSRDQRVRNRRTEADRRITEDLYTSVAHRQSNVDDSLHL